eukprot:1947217-Rhodomonas_salina.1
MRSPSGADAGNVRSLSPGDGLSQEQGRGGVQAGEHAEPLRARREGGVAVQGGVVLEERLRHWQRVDDAEH